MRKAWLFVADRFDALQPRERMAVFFALSAVLVGLFYFLAFNPAYARYLQARSILQQSGQAMAAAHAAELSLLTLAAQDPDAEARAQLAQAVAANASLRQKLAGLQGRLAPADKMPEVLRDLILVQQGLELESIRTAAPENLLGAPADAAAGAGGLYRHSIELRVRGNYQALATYLRELEKLPWQFQLADVHLQAGEYPQSTLSISLSTLSLERTWLSF